MESISLGLYLELTKNPQKTIPEFLQEETIW